MADLTNRSTLASGQTTRVGTLVSFQNCLYETNPTAQVDALRWSAGQKKRTRCLEADRAPITRHEPGAKLTLWTYRDVSKRTLSVSKRIERSLTGSGNPR